MAGPLVIFTWRGTWHNIDALFDQLIFSSLKLSNLFALFTGIAISAILSFNQYKIKVFASEGLKFYVISRLFSIVSFYSDLLQWKGIWGFFNYIIGSSEIVSLTSFAIASCILWGSKTCKSTLGAPFGIGLDRSDYYIAVSTVLSSQVKLQNLRGGPIKVRFTL